MRWDIDPSEIDKRLAEYKPRNIDDDNWTRVSIVAHDCVAKVKLDSVHEAMDLIGTASYFFDYVIQQGHTGLDLRKTLTPQLRDQWLAAANISDGTRRTRRSHLSRIGRAVNPRAGWKYNGKPVKRQQVPAPYSTDEVDELIDVVKSHPSSVTSRVGRVVLGLGVGAGRSSRQIANVAADDLTPSGSGLTLTTPNGVRIGINKRYAKLLKPCLDVEGPLVGHWTQIDNHVSEIVGHAGHRLQVARCRTNWIVEQINNNVGPRQLVAALDLTDFGAIGKYVRLAEPITTSELAIEPAHSDQTGG